MKRSIAALVTAALILAAATPAAHAVSPVVEMNVNVSLRTLNGGGTSGTFHVNPSFSTDTPGAPPFTLQKAVIFFPDHAGTNGRLFPSCGAKQIERSRGDLSRCPEGSKVGGGTLTARVLQLGITVNARVTMFNSHHGEGITFNIQTLHPASINESFDAPLTHLHGTYGEKLTLVVPHSLQEVIPGLFVGVEDFDVTLSGTTRVHGVRLGYIGGSACPKHPLHGVFDFKDWTTGQTATATADTKVDCTNG
jgi:hypothetical protein